MATPEVPQSSSAKNKLSPFGSGTINKSLLTPCRRVGLSRKRKTPLSSLRKSFSEDLNTSSSSTNTCTENETTPLTHTKLSTSRRRKIERNLPQAKKDLRETFTCDDGESNSELPLQNMEHEITTLSIRTESENDLVDKIEIEKVVTVNNNDSLKRKVIDDDSDDDFVITKKSNNSKLSVKKSTSSERKCKVQLRKLSEEDIESSKKPTTLSKKLSVEFDDEADFTSSPQEEKLKKQNLQKDMKVLENEIKQKRLKLENLQRAAIYKSKHNIEELKNLTSIWQGGCLQALKDLFVILQSHGPIDLNVLAYNMGIPKEIIAKLPQVS